MKPYTHPAIRFRAWVTCPCFECAGFRARHSLDAMAPLGQNEKCSGGAQTPPSLAEPHSPESDSAKPSSPKSQR
jgi:hypothetical protein